MGVKRPGESDSDVADVTEDDLNYLDDVGRAVSRTTVSAVVERDKESAPLSAEDLGHVVPGCFVQFGTHGMCCWLEINRVEGDNISGKLRPELSDPICVIEYYHHDVICIRRDEITAMGCDRYCWC